MNNSDARRVNLGRLLGEVISAGTTSRSGLAARTGLSKATVSRLVEALIDNSLVAERPPLQGDGPGRQQRPVEFAADMGLACGVDVGASNTRLMATNLRGQPVGRRRVPTPALLPAGELAEWLAHEVLTLCGKRSQLQVTAVGVPGVVHPATSLVRDAQHLRQIEGEAFVACLREALPGSVMFDNDANFALLGELHFGAAKGCRSAVMFTIGTSIGAGVALGGRLLRGRTGYVGEFSFMPLPNGNVLDAVASGLGIVQTAEAAGFRIESAQEIFAADPPPALAQLRSQALSALATAFGATAVAYEPEVIVVGGGVADSVTPWLPRLAAMLERSISAMPQIVPTALGDLAGTVGALANALEVIYSNLGVDVSVMSRLPAAEHIEAFLASSDTESGKSSDVRSVRSTSGGTAPAHGPSGLISIGGGRE